MKAAASKGETELWRYMSLGDGIKCPIYESCRLRLHRVRCICDNEEYYQALSEFVDGTADFSDPASIEFEFYKCPGGGRIFKLVRSLANRYPAEARIDRPPVPTTLITQAYDNLPIEVRQLPLKAYHGAVWRLSDCWIVQLSSNDTPARQRFTLYHEIFHILAHCKATPVFKKVASRRDGSFNELLADHFSAVILMPKEWIMKIWPEVKDIRQMAAIFDVPQPVMWLAIKSLHLI